jgi:excisionase family DNA binding protein
VNGPKALPAPPEGPAVPVYMTIAQVAAMLQVAPRTVYGWVWADQTLPVLKIGGTLRFPRERLLRWLQQREQGSHRTRELRSSVPRAPRKSALPRASQEATGA